MENIYTPNEYEQQASDFLKAHNAKIKIVFVECGYYFNDDKQPRNIYRFTIKRNGKQYSARFGDSIANTESGEQPTAYDILAALTKSEPYGDIWEFVSEYGYTIDSRESYNAVKKIFNAVKREYKGVERLFGDCLDELAEIN